MDAHVVVTAAVHMAGLGIPAVAQVGPMVGRQVVDIILLELGEGLFDAGFDDGNG